MTGSGSVDIITNMKRNRKAIRRFSYFHLASIALILANNIIYWDFNRAVFATDPRMAGIGQVAFYLFIVAPVIIPLFLWYLVVWKESRIWRWIIIAYAALWLLGIANAIGNVPVLMVTVTTIALVCQSIAIFSLFQPQLTERKSRDGGVDE